jgi:hypothetical protein
MTAKRLKQVPALRPPRDFGVSVNNELSFDRKPPQLESHPMCKDAPIHKSNMGVAPAQ